MGYLQHGRRHLPGGTDPIPGFGAGCYVHIASALANDDENLDLVSLGGYTHLRIEALIRSNGGAGFDIGGVWFNGDDPAGGDGFIGWQFNRWRTNASTNELTADPADLEDWAWWEQMNTNDLELFYIPTNADDDDHLFSVLTIDIPYYSGLDNYKYGTFDLRGFSERIEDDPPFRLTREYGTFYYKKPVPITAVHIGLQQGDSHGLARGCRATAYGICPTVAPAPPSNDNFAEALEITGTSGTSDSIQIDLATVETDEPAGSNLDTPGGIFQSVWFKYVPLSNGTLTVDTVGSNLAAPNDPDDTTLAIWTGLYLTGLSEEGSNDEGAGVHASLVSISVSAGTAYWIQVGVFTDGGTGTILINWSLV